MAKKQSRKKFIESQGATCKNWSWSWSFINEGDKIIIFGAWDKYTRGSVELIFSEGWERGCNGRRKPGYAQSREHIRLVEEKGYQLMTFPMQYSEDEKTGNAKMKGFTPQLTPRSLKKKDKDWYAYPLGGTLS